MTLRVTTAAGLLSWQPKVTFAESTVLLAQSWALDGIFYAIVANYWRSYGAYGIVGECWSVSFIFNYCYLMFAYFSSLLIWSTNSQLLFCLVSMVCFVTCHFVPKPFRTQVISYQLDHFVPYFFGHFLSCNNHFVLRSFRTLFGHFVPNSTGYEIAFESKYRIQVIS